MEETNHDAGGAHSRLTGLEGFFDTYLRAKAPFQFPRWFKEWLVKYGPWIILVLLILTAIVIIPLALIALGLTAISVPFMAAAGQLHMSVVGYISIALSVASLVLEAMAIPGMLKRKLSGWRYAYYAALVSALGALINLDIISLILGLVISMYILFQIREYYK